jgi:hypothetical protein
MSSSSAPIKPRAQTRAEIWGPHYWFFLHSVARTYPNTPNEITKRKYYDLIQNFPLFILDDEMGVQFSHLLDQFPVSPYLTNRDSFMHWMYFIHNKMNYKLEKDEPTYEEATRKYDELFVTPEYLDAVNFRFTKHHYFIGVILVFIFVIWWGFRK